jgi:hypothetical protein
LVRAGVCEASGCGFKSRRPPQIYMTNLNLVKNLNSQTTQNPYPNEKGGVTVSRINKAVDIVRGYDWMLNNPDTSYLSEEVARQITTEGFLRLSVFVCPKFDINALFTDTPEVYMPERVTSNDLFEPRIPRILQIRKDLLKVGIITELNVLIGDNDAEMYIFPYCQNLQIHSDVYKKRQLIYAQNFERRVTQVLGQRCIIWSLSDMGIVLDDLEPSITPTQQSKEMRFFKWLFSQEGPYDGKLIFTDNIAEEMIRLKYRLYGSQGKFLKELGGVLLQTEGPGVWLERTEMLRCTGSTAIPAIYPWIREEELKNME